MQRRTLSGRYLCVVAEAVLKGAVSCNGSVHVKMRADLFPQER